MSRRASPRGQLALDLAPTPAPLPMTAVPHEAVQALADLLLEALGGRASTTSREGGDEFQDHA